ncbi:MAG: DUF3467 domain-containing protein [Planctomycetes bacterium]|nr:DUF3467 domain-containing protein [Planctomycetota bacterium]
MSDKVQADRSQMTQTYCNVMSIVRSEEEVLLEFGMRRVDEPGVVDVLQRIVMSVPHAYRVRDALMRNLGRPEDIMGEEGSS